MRFFFAQRGHLPACGTEFELSPIQCHVLHLIEPGRPLPMSRLADTLSCDASNVTGLVDRLEARGLVRRRPSPQDRRVKVLQLTPPVRDCGRSCSDGWQDGLFRLSRLSLDQQRTLVTILEALVDEKSKPRVSWDDVRALGERDGHANQVARRLNLMTGTDGPLVSHAVGWPNRLVQPARRSFINGNLGSESRPRCSGGALKD